MLLGGKGGSGNADGFGGTDPFVAYSGIRVLGVDLTGTGLRYDTLDLRVKKCDGTYRTEHFRCVDSLGLLLRNRSITAAMP